MSRSGHCLQYGVQYEWIFRDAVGDDGANDGVECPDEFGRAPCPKMAGRNHSRRTKLLTARTAPQMSFNTHRTATADDGASFLRAVQKIVLPTPSASENRAGRIRFQPSAHGPRRDALLNFVGWLSEGKRPLIRFLEFTYQSWHAMEGHTKTGSGKPIIEPFPVHVADELRPISRLTWLRAACQSALLF